MFQLHTIKGKTIRQIDGDMILNAIRDEMGIGMNKNSCEGVSVNEQNNTVHVCLEAASKKSVLALILRHDSNFSLVFDGKKYDLFAEYVSH